MKYPRKWVFRGRPRSEYGLYYTVEKPNDYAYAHFQDGAKSRCVALREENMQESLDSCQAGWVEVFEDEPLVLAYLKHLKKELETENRELKTQISQALAEERVVLPLPSPRPRRTHGPCVRQRDRGSPGTPVDGNGRREDLQGQ